MNFNWATTADALVLAEMNWHLIRDEGHRNRMTKTELEARMTEWLDGEYEAILFEEPEQTVGYALFRRDREYVYLRQFYIRPEYRRRGFGSTAMGWLWQHAWGGVRVRVEVLVGTAAALDVLADQQAVLAALDANELDHQAKTLLCKRFHEVAKLLPHTCARLGERGWEQFMHFSAGFWPTGHLRHLMDAVAFGTYLLKVLPGCVSRSELNRVKFQADSRRFACHLTCDAWVNGRRRPGIQFLYRFGGTPRQLLVYLGA